MGIGQTAALTAAALWAFSSLLYTRINLSAWGLNFSKILIATMILLVQLAIVSRVNGEAIFHGSTGAWKWLAFSGIIGLVVGDTCYFRSLQILGVRRCLIVTTTAPIFAAILGWIYLRETLMPMAMAGVMLTVVGVCVVVADQTTKDDEPGLFPGSIASGLGFGIGAAICQAIGVVSSKYAMQQCDALEATFIRLASAAVVALAIVLGKRRLTETLKAVFKWSVLKSFLPAIVCGTWLGVWFSQIAIQKISPASAQTLLSTSPLFILPIAWWLTKKRPTNQILAGAVAAVIGVFLIVH